MFDCAVIGGGIVGLATAMELLRRQPGIKLVVLEKESDLPFTKPGATAALSIQGSITSQEVTRRDLRAKAIERWSSSARSTEFLMMFAGRWSSRLETRSCPCSTTCSAGDFENGLT